METPCVRAHGYVLGDEIRKATLKGVTLRHGWSVRDGGRVCVKIIAKQHMNEMSRTMLDHELSILNVMHGDPGCVSLIECFEDTENVYLVLEDFVIDCTDVQTLLASQTRFSEEHALLVFRRLVEVVQRLHDKNIAHRDLKLPHIVIDSRHEVKITDFSLGTMVDGGCGGYVRDQRGSPAYISPEVLSGRPYCAFASDVWSLGIILYKMLVGRFPFHEKNAKLLFDKIKVGAFAMPAPGTVSPDVARLLRYLINLTPHDRPTAHQLLVVTEKMLAQRAAANQDACVEADDHDQVVPTTAATTARST